MTHELQSPAGTTVAFALSPSARVAEEAGFDWLVTPLALTATVLPLNAACTEVLRGLPVTITPLGDTCEAGSEQVNLSVRFRAPFTVGAYKVVFLVDNIDQPSFHLELEAGTLFVTPRATRASRAPGVPHTATPPPQPPVNGGCGCECQDMVVDSYADRDLIPLDKRCEGVQLVYVQEDHSHWVLIGGVSNTNWTRWRAANMTIINGGGATFRGPLTPPIL